MADGRNGVQCADEDIRKAARDAFKKVQRKKHGWVNFFVGKLKLVMKKMKGGKIFALLPNSREIQVCNHGQLCKTKLGQLVNLIRSFKASAVKAIKRTTQPAAQFVRPNSLGAAFATH